MRGSGAEPTGEGPGTLLGCREAGIGRSLEAFDAENRSSGLATWTTGQHLYSHRGERTVFMANTKALSKDERKKSKRTARKKKATETPLKKRDYARGSAKRKVKKLVRGASKR